MHVWQYADLTCGPLLNVKGVGVSAATSKKDTVRFTRIHAECGTQITQPKWCPECGKVVEAGDTVRQVYKSDVRIEDDEYNEAVGVRYPAIPITKFVPWATTGTYPAKQSYHLVPPPTDTEGVYPLLVRVMMEKEVDGFGHANLGGRDKPFFVTPIGGRLMLHLLYAWHELVLPDFDPPEMEFSKETVKLAEMIVDAATEPLDDAEDLASEPEALLRAMIEAKAKGRKLAPEPLQMPSDPTQDLMEALKETYEKGLVAA